MPAVTVYDSSPMLGYFGTCDCGREIGSTIMTKLVDEIRRLLREGHTVASCQTNSEHQLIRALTMVINDTDTMVRQRACWELGKLISRLDPSAIETFIQRLLWRLNPESGDNPHGIPEAIGEIGCRAPQQIEPFVPALLQYFDDETLLPGLLQAAGRIGQGSPHVLYPYAHEIASHLRDSSLAIAANAAFALSRIGGNHATEALRVVESDAREVTLFCDDVFITIKLRELAKHCCGQVEKLCFIAEADNSGGA